MEAESDLLLKQFVCIQRAIFHIVAFSFLRIWDKHTCQYGLWPYSLYYFQSLWLEQTLHVRMPAIWRDERRNIWGIFRTMHWAFREWARHFAQVKRRQSDARSAERFNQLYQDVRTSLTIWTTRSANCKNALIHHLTSTYKTGNRNAYVQLIEKEKINAISMAMSWKWRRRRLGNRYSYGCGQFSLIWDLAIPQHLAFLDAQISVKTQEAHFKPWRRGKDVYAIKFKISESFIRTQDNGTFVYENEWVLSYVLLEVLVCPEEVNC